jgi:ubiquinone biosynthesis protein UbiJ
VVGWIRMLDLAMAQHDDARRTLARITGEVWAEVLTTGAFRCLRRLIQIVIFYLYL